MDAAALTVACSLFRRMRGQEVSRPRDAGLLADLRAGWSVVAGRRWLGSTLAYFAFFNAVVMSCIYVIGPEVAVTHYTGASTWGALLAAYGIGGVVAAGLGQPSIRLGGALGSVGGPGCPHSSR